MVSISKGSVQKTQGRRVKKSSGRHSILEKLQSGDLTAIVLGMVIGYSLYLSLHTVTGTISSVVGGSKNNRIVNSQNIVKLNFESSLGASYEAIAIDILDTLDCVKFLNETMPDWKRDLGNINNGNDANNGRLRTRGRRLANTDDNDDPSAARRAPQRENGETLPDDFGEGGENGGGDVGEDLRLDDDFGGLGLKDSKKFGHIDITGKHLFCIAAVSAMTNLPNKMKSTMKVWKDNLKCDATETKQQTLFNLWSAARAEIPDLSLLKKTLEVSKENKFQLWNHTLNLWSPDYDQGLYYTLQELNSAKPADHGGIHGLHNNLGPGHTFVDVGSCLGTTTLAVSLLYPGTRIVSIEPAAPNWLMQEMNLRCNLLQSYEEQYPTVLLSGVGPTHTNHHETMMAKFIWRSDATSSTHAWTPAAEKTQDDIELTVKLRSWKVLLAEAEIFDIGTHHIDVLNVDCEGCEYNLIPALTDEEYENIDTVMGGCHWGYIPQHKLPSTKRAHTTHHRLCQHENIARISKECCEFPDMPVRSSTPGEMLIKDNNEFPPKPSTVSDVAGELCNDFTEWSKNNRLFDVVDDFGWFQLTSTAN